MKPIDLEAHWVELRERAERIVEQEPVLRILLNETVLDRGSFAESLTYRITRKLVNHGASVEVLQNVFLEAFEQQPEI
ncbi:MAG: serine O-acetyltransferase, partial [Opitutales bacterium]